MSENQITDVIDMTNTSCKEGTEKITLPSEIRLFTPVFTTPLDNRQHKANRRQVRTPILPGITYPFELTSYNFPCDLGTYLFWHNYMSASVQLDCKLMKMHNGQDLL